MTGRIAIFGYGPVRRRSRSGCRQETALAFRAAIKERGRRMPMR